MQQTVSERVKSKQNEMKQNVNQKAHTKTILVNVGDFVHVKKFICGHKLNPSCSEPIEVVAVNGPTLTLVDGHKLNSSNFLVHNPNLAPAFTLPGEQTST